VSARVASSLPPEPSRRRLRAALARFAGFLALWLVLSGGEPLSPWLAALIVSGATAISLRMLPPAAVRPGPERMLRFLPYFLYASLRGGVDVALRAIGARGGAGPGAIAYPLRLPEGPGRTFFVAVVGLLPGTMTTAVYADRIMVHVLDTGGDAISAVRALEHRVADLFGIRLDLPGSLEGDGS
jgi:multicomponent Na+:H+ antiporter subunit E